MRVITLNGDEALNNYSKPIVAELRAIMVRVDSDFSATPFKAKTSNAEQLRVHTMLVIGGRDMEAGAVSFRLHHDGPQGGKPKEGRPLRRFRGLCPKRATPDLPAFLLLHSASLKFHCVLRLGNCQDRRKHSCAFPLALTTAFARSRPLAMSA